MARVMMLAAGLGTRLRPLTDELPKALMPIGDRSLLMHVADRLARAGFTEMVMNAHHLREQFALKISELNIDVHLVYEAVVRGTAGGIAGARDWLGPAPVIVWNGDVLADAPLAGLLDAAAPGGLAWAVAPRPRGEGTVGVDARGSLVRLRGETFGAEAAGGDYVCIAAIGARALSELPAQGCLVEDYALPALRRGETIATVPHEGPWIDIGSLGTYHGANLRWLRDQVGEGASFVDPAAEVGADVTLSESIIGRGASVMGEGVLERCVVWPGATARAPLRNAVVTTAGRVVPLP